MCVLPRGRRRICLIRYLMLLAGIVLRLLLVLSDARAIYQQSNRFLPFINFSFGFVKGASATRGISVTRILPDGEMERIIRLPEICAKETIINWGNTDIALRQVWLSKATRRLQFIYEGGTLSDCVEEKTISKSEKMCTLSINLDDYDDNTTIELFDMNNQRNMSKTSRSLVWLSSASNLRYQCAHVRNKTRNQLFAQHRHRMYTELRNGTNSRHRQRRGKSRSRRNLLMIPGTQWCGRGDRATKYTNLGGFGKADACCRRHDTACPFFIPAFETRYGLFNWGISSMMHCACDERFRTCLKMAGTSSANFIGKIFFDVLKTKCFILKPQKVCAKWSWTGKCQRHEYRKQAHVRGNVPYY